MLLGELLFEDTQAVFYDGYEEWVITVFVEAAVWSVQ